MTSTSFKILKNDGSSVYYDANDNNKEILAEIINEYDQQILNNGKKKYKGFTVPNNIKIFISLY